MDLLLIISVLGDQRQHRLGRLGNVRRSKPTFAGVGFTEFIYTDVLRCCAAVALAGEAAGLPQFRQRLPADPLEVDRTA